MAAKNNHPVLDVLLSEYGIKTDVQLAEELKTSPALLSQIRCGRDIGDMMRVRIMRRFGLSIWDLDDLEAKQS